MRSSLVLIAFVAVACSDGTAPATRPIRTQTTSPSIPLAEGVKVDTLFDSRYTVSGINNAGEIVGAFQPNSTTPTEAFRFRPGVGTEFLSQNATLVPGSVNDQGDMVTSFGFTQGAVWQNSGRVVMLPDLFPDSNTVCLDGAINDQRTVIGACQTGNGTFYPVEWIGEGQPQVLSANGVSLIGAQPIAINNVGAIAGSTVSSQAFVLMPDHRIRFLPNGFVASAVNNAGWTGGTVSGFGVVWTPADSEIDIAPGGQMLGINNANVAVGYETCGTCSGTSAVVWRQSVGARQLPCLAPAGTFEDDQAFAINEQGQVLGGALVFGANGQMTSYNVLWILPAE